MERATRGLVPNGTNSFTNMPLSTSSTYVYSKPVTNSNPTMIDLGQQDLPTLAFRGKMSEGLYFGIYVRLFK